jgi:hypothetical protein
MPCELSTHIGGIPPLYWVRKKATDLTNLDVNFDEVSLVMQDWVLVDDTGAVLNVVKASA